MQSKEESSPAKWWEGIFMIYDIFFMDDDHLCFALLDDLDPDGCLVQIK
jgi:hypothetical protein